MIIFGSGSAHLKTVTAKNSSCSYCENKGTISFSIYRKHAHIFWIPFFPMNKTGASHCHHCQQVLKPAAMPERLKREYTALKGDTKGPIWQFSGLFIVVCLLAFAGYSSTMDKENTEKYLSEPAIGDVYEYRISIGNYSTMKIKRITPDSLFMSFNAYEISRSSNSTKIDKVANYPDTLHGVARKDLASMRSDGIILKINRN